MKTPAIALCAFVLTSCQMFAVRDNPAASWDCDSGELQQSWAQIERSVADAGKAQKLANAIICLPRNKEVNDYINAHLDESIETSSYGTGDLEEERNTLTSARSKDRFGGYGGSSDFTYTASLDELGTISLEARNEACIDDTVLRHRGSDWIIAEYHNACD